MATTTRKKKAAATLGSVAALPACCFAEPASGRGRPALKSLPSSDTRHRRGGPDVARRVFELELRIGAHRGALMEAVRRVAGQVRMSEETVKRYATRYRALRTRTRTLAQMVGAAEEADRRMSGMPVDVQSALKNTLTLGGLLRLLRENDVDGACPQWLVDAVRRGDLLSPK